MILHKIRIDMPSCRESYKIRCIEPHFHSAGHDAGLFADFARRQRGEKNSFWICPGDLIDPDRPSSRDRKEQARLGRKESWLQDDEMAQTWIDKKILPKLEPIASRCLGLIDGDHYIQFADGTTSTQYICDKLGIKYLGERMCYVGMVFSASNSNHSGSLLYTILPRHGRGGSSTASGDMAALERQNAHWRADCYFGAHTHKEHAHPTVELFPNAAFTDLAQRIAWYVRCGSFLRGFLPGHENVQYAEKKEYGPLVCGWGEMDITVAKSHRNNSNLAIVESSGRTLAF